MTAFVITDEENHYLLGLSWGARVAYIQAIRPFMDYGTGVVGIRRGISRQSIAEVLYIEPKKGRHTKLSGSPTHSAVRCILEELEDGGLLKKIPDPDKLIFFLPKAFTDQSAQNMSIRSASDEHPTGASDDQPAKKANKSKRAQQPEQQSASDHLIPNMSMSGPPPLSVNRQSQSQSQRINIYADSQENSQVLIPQNLDMTDPVVRVFAHWQIAMNKPEHILDAKRRKAIADRLRDGYSVEQLMLAITGCAQSKWHAGQNKSSKAYQDIELICRDASHVDSFIEIVQQQKVDTRNWDSFLYKENLIKGEVIRG